MELALGAVTVLALVMTVAMGVVTWRLVREERRRSAARVAALEAELEKHLSTRAAPARAPLAVMKRASSRVPLIDVPIRHADTAPATRGQLFGTADTTSGSWSRRIVSIGMATVLIAAAIGLAVFTSLDRPRETEPPTPMAAQVELLALEHERQGSFLAISGTARMAAGAVPPSPLAVMAMIYDEEGLLVASGRAPLDLGDPDANGDTPFSILLPADDASRFRISFLSDETTVPHVDRRPTHANRDSDAETTSARNDQ